MPPRKKTEAEIKKERWDNLANLRFSTASVGDSFESRLFGDQLLGGGFDPNTGQGLMGSWPAQGGGMQPGVGQDGDPRVSVYSNGKMNTQTTRWAWNRIQACRSVYENDGQVSSIVDLMADFVSEGFRFVHKKKSVEKFFNAWAKQIDLKGRLRRCVIDLIIAGTTFYYKVYAKLTPSEISTLKNFASGLKVDNGILVTTDSGKEIYIEPKIQYDESVASLFECNADEIPDKIKSLVLAKIANKETISIKEEESKVEKGRIPWKYISLNPLQMYPNESGGWSYLMTKDDVEKLVTQLDIQFDSTSKSVEVSLPSGFSGKLKKLQNTIKGAFYAEMELDPSRLIVVDYGKFDWSKWSIPMLWKVLPTVMFKSVLRQMEMKTAQAGINTVTLWKIGDHKEGLLPTAEHFERLADMLKAPSATLNILWSSAIEAQVIQPNLSQIFDVKRWEELRKEVTAQFGITQAVVTGEGGSFSSSYISVQGLIQRLETLREIVVSSWLFKDTKDITKAMGFRNIPRIIFGNMSLRDEKAEKTLLLGLLDRGFISDETALEAIGVDVDVERRRLQDQAKFDDENDMVRRGPFMIPEGQAEIVAKQLKSQEKMAEESTKVQEKVQMTKVKQEHEVNMEMVNKNMHPKQLKAVQPVSNNKVKKVKKVNGRPPGSTGPQKNKRTPKPKNVASVDVRNFINNADLIAKQAVTSLENKAFYKELSKKGKESVLDLVSYAVAESLYEDGEKPDVEKFKTLATTGVNLANDHVNFIQAFNEECLAFRTREGRKPTKDETYNMFVAAYMKEINELNNEDIPQSAEAIIRHEGGKWVIYNHDGTKKLGTYDSKDEAVKRLREIEYFKSHPNS